MAVPSPTSEQAGVVSAFCTGGSVRVEAGAGTGKTTALMMLAVASPRRRGLYVAYNKATAEDARRSFPSNVECRTAHSLAFRAVARPYTDRLFNAPRITSYTAAEILGISRPLGLGDCVLRPTQMASLAQETVSRFCNSTAVQVEAVHVPQVTGIDSPEHRTSLAQALLPYARAVWEDLADPSGRLRFTHDHYLKMWQLTAPVLPFDFVLLDEAQDADPVIADVVGAQKDRAQLVYVGDSSQAIYGWRGAVDAMSSMRADHVLYLTQSFRFGPAVADEANKWLFLLGAQLRLTGSPTIASRLGSLSHPRAVLCRSNARTLQEVLDAHAAGVPVAVVGGAVEAKSMAQAALQLQSGKATTHRELAAFQTWKQVQDYVEDDRGGADLKLHVNLIDTYGAQKLIAALTRTVPESKARRVVSTAHKAKGREWPTVRIADDFPEPSASPGRPGGGLVRAEAMLAYVAVTRARDVLDRGGVAWVDQRLPLPPRTPDTEPVHRPDRGLRVVIGPASLDQCSAQGATVRVIAGSHTSLVPAPTASELPRPARTDAMAPPPPDVQTRTWWRRLLDRL